MKRKYKNNSKDEQYFIDIHSMTESEYVIRGIFIGIILSLPFWLFFTAIYMIVGEK